MRKADHRAEAGSPRVVADDSSEARDFLEQAADLAVDFQRGCSLAAFEGLMVAAGAPGGQGLDAAAVAAHNALVQLQTLDIEVAEFLISVAGGPSDESEPDEAPVELQQGVL